MTGVVGLSTGLRPLDRHTLAVRRFAALHLLLGHRQRVGQLISRPVAHDAGT